MINERSVIFWKRQNYRRDIRLVFARAQNERTKITTKEHLKTFCIDEIILYMVVNVIVNTCVSEYGSDCGSEYMTLYICQNS